MDITNSEKLQNTKLELQQTQTELQLAQYQLQQAQSELELTQSQLQQSQNAIKAMESSKFWKLRENWLRLKGFLRLVDLNAEIKLSNLVTSSNSNPIRKYFSSKQTSQKPTQLNSYKKQITQMYMSVFENFLYSDNHIEFTYHKKPLVTVIIILYNRAELTYQCLRSLYDENLSVELEIIILDNASTDQTNVLLDRLKGVKIIRNPQNIHFLLAANQGGANARGEYILFLNNDAQVQPGSINSAIKTIKSHQDIGAVGGKIILMDGSLQEAGNIVWKDGSCLGYGRGDSPFAPMYTFVRDVDYCSGAFLLTNRELFLKNGGFDRDYEPAYYEETDYCLKLWQQGKRVVYDPNAVILHFEFASSRSTEAAIELQETHKQILVKKHFEKLQTHYNPEISNALLARSANKNSQRILFIDDRIPYSFLGSGFPRCRSILQSLVANGYLVTFYPISSDSDNWQAIYQDIPREVEVMIDGGIAKLEDFLRQRSGFYQTIFVSRPHNMRLLKPIITHHPELFTNTKIIYDAEAIYALREIEQLRLAGKKLSQEKVEALIKKEVELSKQADTIVTVSEQEKEYFLKFGFNSVNTLGHTVPVTPTESTFEKRSGILFVGAIHDDNSPNADSVLWFVKEILPKIQAKLEFEVKFTVAGFNNSSHILELQSNVVKILGKVDNLSQLYEDARLFVAPTRFAAGIPFKVHHASAHGLPIVTTSLIASQLGWQDEKELLVADNSEIFAQKCLKLYDNSHCWQTLRENALKKISRECSEENFTSNLQKILF